MRAGPAFAHTECVRWWAIGLLCGVLGLARAGEPPPPEAAPPEAAPAEAAPAGAAPAEAASAGAAPAEASPWLLGSDPDLHLELELQLLHGWLKPHSHFAFGDKGSELSFVNDLGFSRTVTLWGALGRVGLQRFGWLGGELLVFEQDRQAAVIDRARQLEGSQIYPGDVLRTDASLVWGRFHWGWELRRRFAPSEDLQLDLFVSPTLGLGLYHLIVQVDRVYPDYQSRLGGGRAMGVIVAPGVRAGVELVGWACLFVEAEWVPAHSTWLSLTHVPLDEWEQLRAGVSLCLGPLVLEGGIRWLNSELEEKGHAEDGKSSLRIRAGYFAAGFRF